MAKAFLHMTGLCLFVQKKDPNQDTDRKKNLTKLTHMQVMLLGDQPNHGHLDVHVPVIVFDMRSLIHDPSACRPLTRDADLTFWEPREHRKPRRMGLCFLDEYHLSIPAPDDRDVSLSMKDGIPEGGVCPTPADREYFSWVTNVEKFGGGVSHSPFCEKFCDERTLGARLHLVDGTLRVEQLVGNEDFVMKLDFQDSNGSVDQRAAAEFVELTTEIDDAVNALVFQFEHLRSGNNRKGKLSLLPLCLRPLQVGGEDQVHVWIKTVPLLDILGERPASGDFDEHFSNIYRFSEPGLVANPEDWAIPGPGSGCWGPSSCCNPNCSPATCPCEK